MKMERALDPDLVLVDSHHHLWDREGFRYLLPDLREDINTGHKVVSTVFVECGSGLQSAYALDKGAFDPFRLAVGDGSSFLGMTRMALWGVSSGFPTSVLRRSGMYWLVRTFEVGRGRFRGVRYKIAHDMSEDIPVISDTWVEPIMEEPSFCAGMLALRDAGLSFDTWMYHTQLPQLIGLAHTHSEVVIILDHLGGPIGIGPYAGRRKEVREAWRASIRELARCENVFLKLGGIGMPVLGQGLARASGMETDVGVKWRLPGAMILGGASTNSVQVGVCLNRTSRLTSNRVVMFVLWNSFKRISSR